MKKSVILSCLLLGTTCVAQAEGNKEIKPGLWEIQHKTSVDGQKVPDMKEMLSQVPPEMRGQVEAMMAKQGAGMTDKGLTTCITPEQAASQHYGTDPDGQCQVKDMQQEGDVTRLKIQCSQPKGEGEATVTRLGPEAWKSTTRMTVEENGAAHTMNSESTARWLGADCAAVKPSGSGKREEKPEGKQSNQSASQVK